MTPEERQRIAYHESGHAIVTASMGKRESLNRVSIVGRGRGLGQSTVTEENDRVLLTGEELEAQLAIAMGGVAAEVIQFGRSSTTAEDDIEKATGVAREMVGLYGMSTELGRVRVLSKYSGFLGGDTSLDSVSERTMQDFDDEVKRLITVAEQRATMILDEHRPDLERMAERLKVDETLEETALEGLVATVQLRTDLLLTSPDGSGGNGRPSSARSRPVRSRTPGRSTTTSRT